MKKLTSFALSSIIGFTGVTAISLLNPVPIQAESVPTNFVRFEGGRVYSAENNQHGSIIRTSVGTFYIGKSGDAIRQVNKQRYYGYWKKTFYTDDSAKLVVYIQDRTYLFDIYAAVFNF